jgi:hypothetical protein
MVAVADLDERVRAKHILLPIPAVPQQLVDPALVLSTDLSELGNALPEREMTPLLAIFELSRVKDGNEACALSVQAFSNILRGN